MGIQIPIFLYHQTSQTSIGRSFTARTRFRVPSAKAAPRVGTPLAKVAIRAGMFLLSALLRAIEHPLIGYRETIPVPIDEFLFLGRVLYFFLYFPF
jgi:hypothetical protein